MKTMIHSHCLESREFASYMIGTVYNQDKGRIERHLTVCNTCFELFISAFNQYLDNDVVTNAAPESMVWHVNQPSPRIQA